MGEGDFLAEVVSGVLARGVEPDGPAAVLPLETYSRERKAEFLLTNATDEDDYRRAVEAVRAMGLDLEVVAEAGSTALPEDVDLPETDRPILRAALRSNATHLITGVLTHFGPHLDDGIEGVRVVRPADLLRD